MYPYRYTGFIYFFLVLKTQYKGVLPFLLKSSVSVSVSSIFAFVKFVIVTPGGLKAPTVVWARHWCALVWQPRGKFAFLVLPVHHVDGRSLCERHSWATNKKVSDLILHFLE